MSAGKSIKNLYSTHILSPPNQQHIGIIVMAFQCWSCGVSWKLKSLFWKVEWIQFMTLWLVEMFVAADLVCHDNQKAVRQSFHFVKFRHAKFGGHHSGSFSKQLFLGKFRKRRFFHGIMDWWTDESALQIKIRLKGESFFSVVGNVIATDSSAFGFDVLTNKLHFQFYQKTNLFAFSKIQVLHISLEQMYVSLTQIPNVQSPEVSEALNSWVL